MKLLQHPIHLFWHRIQEPSVQLNSSVNANEMKYQAYTVFLPIWVKSVLITGTNWGVCIEHLDMELGNFHGNLWFHCNDIQWKLELTGKNSIHCPDNSNNELFLYSATMNTWLVCFMSCCCSSKWACTYAGITKSHTGYATLITESLHTDAETPNNEILNHLVNNEWLQSLHQ